MQMKIQNNSTFLFQGDSVTDAGRDKEDLASLGNGYPMMFASWFSVHYPNIDVNFINRGIGGNRVRDLEARWQKDCLDLKPNWVSILIGINDCWRRYDRNDPTSVEKFEAGYRNILTQIRDNLDANIILCEPFVLPLPEDRIKWREDLDPKINAVRNLAREFNAYLVPLDGIFAQASTAKPSSFWTRDGVHPTPAGHALIAKSIFEVVEKA
jgi:acyl-CoA thioesterase-1